MTEEHQAAQLGALALETLDAGIHKDICEALGSGRLTKVSTAAVRAEVAGGRPRAEDLIRRLQVAWKAEAPSLEPEQLGDALFIAAAAIAAERHVAPRAQVVWTGPRVEGSFLRSTRDVVREIVAGARRELWIVGYWLAGRGDGEGIIADLVALMSEAVLRGVAVKVVLDERPRSDGRDNRGALLDLWPAGAPLPRLLTWRLSPDDRHLKLHAKVMVADGIDSLVTSANLTAHAMDRNIELGVRITGTPAAAISHHLSLLEHDRIFETFDGASPA